MRDLTLNEKLEIFKERMDKDYGQTSGVRTNEDDSGIFRLNIRNQFYKEFSELIAVAIHQVPKEDRNDFIADLQDISSVYGSNYDKFLTKLDEAK